LTDAEYGCQASTEVSASKEIFLKAAKEQKELPLNAGSRANRLLSRSTHAIVPQQKLPNTLRRCGLMRASRKRSLSVRSSRFPTLLVRSQSCLLCGHWLSVAQTISSTVLTGSRMRNMCRHTKTVRY